MSNTELIGFGIRCQLGDHSTCQYAQCACRCHNAPIVPENPNSDKHHYETKHRARPSAADLDAAIADFPDVRTVLKQFPEAGELASKPADWEEARCEYLYGLSACGYRRGDNMHIGSASPFIPPLGRHEFKTSGAGLETQAEYALPKHILEQCATSGINPSVLLEEIVAADYGGSFYDRPEEIFAYGWLAAIAAAPKPEEAPDAGFEEWLATRRDGYHQGGRWYLEDHEVARMRECWIAARKGGRS